jgi:hypothetical protein
LVFEQATVSLRDRAAHPATYSFGMPNDSSLTIGDLAETINKLWGRDTPGGRRYPAPLERELIALGRRPDGNELVFFHGEDLEQLAIDRRSWMFELILSAPSDQLYEFDPDFEMTAYPAERVAGPVTWEGAVAAWQASPESKRRDSVRHQDRLFTVGVVGGQAEMPRSIAGFAQLDSLQGTRRRWYVIQADVSYDARGHVIHELESGLSAEQPVGTGPCWRCAVHTWLANGDWETARDVVAARIRTAIELR